MPREFSNARARAERSVANIHYFYAMNYLFEWAHSGRHISCGACGGVGADDDRLRRNLARAFMYAGNMSKR